MEKVAIYIRVSTLDQAQNGYSLDVQEQQLRRWCEDKGYSVYKLYADRGISGKDISHRPAMQQLLTDAKEKRFNIVLFWALSRFTRSVSDLYHTMQIFQKVGVEMTSYTESFDTSSPFGRAIIGIVGIFAQLERELTCERVAAAMRVWAYKGGLTTHRILGYDYVDGELLPCEKEAAIVNLIFDTYISTHSLKRVADLCAALGYCGKLGKPFTPYTVRKIITNSRYLGKNIFHGELCPGEVPAIISEKKFVRAQKILKKQRDRFGRKTD